MGSKLVSPWLLFKVWQILRLTAVPAGVIVADEIFAPHPPNSGGLPSQDWNQTPIASGNTTRIAVPAPSLLST
jgi:hypothetical protein